MEHRKYYGVKALLNSEHIIAHAVAAFNESAPKEKLGIETLWVTNFNRFSEIPCDSLPITTTAWEGNCSL